MSYGFVTRVRADEVESPKFHWNLNVSLDPTALGTVAPSMIAASVVEVSG
jgi:hypothetical protein